MSLAPVASQYAGTVTILSYPCLLHCTASRTTPKRQPPPYAPTRGQLAGRWAPRNSGSADAADAAPAAGRGRQQLYVPAVLPCHASVRCSWTTTSARPGHSAEAREPGSRRLLRGNGGGKCPCAVQCSAVQCSKPGWQQRNTLGAAQASLVHDWIRSDRSDRSYRGQQIQIFHVQGSQTFGGPAAATVRMTLPVVVGMGRRFAPSVSGLGGCRTRYAQGKPLPRLQA